MDELLTGLTDAELENEDLLLHLLKSVPKIDLRYLQVILFASKGIGNKIEMAKLHNQDKFRKIIPLPLMLWVKVIWSFYPFVIDVVFCLSLHLTFTKWVGEWVQTLTAQSHRCSHQKQSWCAKYYHLISATSMEFILIGQEKRRHLRAGRILTRFINSHFLEFRSASRILKLCSRNSHL